MSKDTITINRAPVLTLWAAVVAERVGFRRDEALSLGKALAGLNAQAKGRALGIFKPSPAAVKKASAEKRGEEFWVELCGRSIPAKNTKDGVRAVAKDKTIAAESVQRYLEQKFGESLERSREAMTELVASCSSRDLAEQAFSLYEQFRPEVPRGQRGWGARGKLDLGLIRSLAGHA